MKTQSNNYQVKAQLADGAITVSAFIYMKLEKKFTSLTNTTIAQAIQYINEIAKQL